MARTGEQAVERTDKQVLEWTDERTEELMVKQTEERTGEQAAQVGKDSWATAVRTGAEELSAPGLVL